MTIQTFSEQTMSRTRKVQTPRPTSARQVKNKVKSMLIIFFDIKWIVNKEFVLADQTVHSAYCCDVLRSTARKCEKTSPLLNFGDKSTGCCIATTHPLTLRL
jgi:hypothetical protein